MTAHRILAQAAAAGFAELPTTYTLGSWTVGWLTRLLFQVAFFALLGQVAGSTGHAQYILLGNTVAVVAMEVMFVCTTAARERFQGTFPLLLAAPARMGLVYLGRGLHWVCTGLASSVIVLTATSAVFPVTWGWREIAMIFPLLILVALSSYAFSCLLAALALRDIKLRNLYPELGFLVVAAFCGVNVPVSFWPTPITWVAQFLPLTHGLRAVRALVAHEPVSAVLLHAALEVGVALSWGVLTALAFESLAGKGRRDGSISFTT